MKVLIVSALLALATAAPRLGPAVPMLITQEDSYIVNGDDAELGQFGYQGALLAGTTPTASLTCGSVYIGADWILCAAHCTQSTARSTTLGLLKLSDRSDAQHFTFSRIVNHPDYGSGPGAFPNDISLAQMTTTPEVGDNVYAADLSEGDDDFAGEDVIISGWGRTCGSCALADNLQFVGTRVLPNYGGEGTCEGYWGNNVNDGHICIISDNQDAGSCNGDSGGPMSIGSTVIGITSWGASGCLTNYPAGYSRVSFFRDWIREVSGI